MNGIKDIWFKTNLDLDDLAKKLNFEIEEFDYENVYEWVIADIDGVKIDIARNHTEKRSQTFTSIFRIEPHKADFSQELLNYIISKLQKIDITPIYTGESWFDKNDEFKYKLLKTIE